MPIFITLSDHPAILIYPKGDEDTYESFPPTPEGAQLFKARIRDIPGPIVISSAVDHPTEYGLTPEQVRMFVR